MRSVSFCDGVWFGGEPNLEDLDLARRRGVLRVIALGEPAALDLHGVCSDLGLAAETVPLGENGWPTDAEVERVLALLAGPGAPETLLFARDASTAVGVFTVHRIVHSGVPYQRALLEARGCGLRRGSGDRFVMEQIDRLEPPEGDGSGGLGYGALGAEPTPR